MREDNKKIVKLAQHAYEWVPSRIYNTNNRGPLNLLYQSSRNPDKKQQIKDAGNLQNRDITAEPWNLIGIRI